MTATTTRDRTQSRPRTIRWGDVIISVIGLAIAAVLFYGAATMEVRGQAVPGPEFFPVLVGILLTAVSGYLLVRAIIPRKRTEEHTALRPDVSSEMLTDVGNANTQVIALEQEHEHEAPADDDDAPTHDINWRATGVTIGAVLGFILLLPLLGWVITAALLFGAVTIGFGSKRIWFNLGVGLLISSIVQLVFSGLLGLTLPAGFLGGIF
ncbi:tripartite tricarboxylate transporter TctB family protein [Gulosibacter sp. ACHW.36C]|uniref:Tripartite tricarboxylate transporter TctB family protein n=1 Tax=Gulosibacter sediminis TaxID=1729695 RepID=A0ABY4MX18_9MICO|nr:tripartite tricarboxylate transporter TctB family protein [Gulosibacter sediminis]UQN14919.1 tripartite tricarboxylate transporter TctB family protein [Gulosibacter sediminis]